MKKLAFISLAVLGFGGVTEMVLGMNPPDEGQCSQSNCNQKEIKLEGSDKGKEKVDQVADVTGNDSETTAMIEGIVKQAKDLQEQMRDLVQQVKIAQERANSLTMQETLSPEEKEKIRQYKEIEKKEPTCCFPRSPEIVVCVGGRYPKTPKQEKEEMIRKRIREGQIIERLSELEKERDYWMAYIDGRKKTPWNQIDSLEEHIEKREKAPEKIRSIEREMVNLRAQFN